MAAVLFLFIAGFYWKLTLTRQFDWMSGPDLAEQVLPWFQVQAHEWHLGRFPLWDPYLWTGQPLFGQAQPGAAYPLNWMLFLLPFENGHLAGWALAWYFVAIHLMAAGFSYLFCRDLGRSRTAGLAGGLIFALSGYLGNTTWPQMMNGAVWAPLVFLFQFRAVRGLRPLANAALSGMFLGIALLGGHHQVPVLVALAWAGVWIWSLPPRSPSSSSRSPAPCRRSRRTNTGISRDAGRARPTRSDGASPCPISCTPGTT